MLSELEKLAEQYAMNVIMDGTNASDAHAYRPGMQALAEHDVYSPLMKYSKEDIRALARKLKLGTEDFASTSCLLTRFPYDTRITREMIERVKDAESYIAALGITQCRVRNHCGIARIEIHEKDLARLMAASASIVNAFIRLGFIYVTLDLQWFRSGSMDHTVEIGAAPSFNIQRARMEAQSSYEQSVNR